MRSSPHNGKYRAYAREFLAYYVRCGYGSLEKICSDYRAGSVTSGGDIYCCMGGLYTTTPEKPAKSIVVHSIIRSRPLAVFPVDEIYREVMSRV